jgi:hypothetical protein
MLLTHKRNGVLISQFKVQNAIKVRQLMSINLLKFEVEYDRDIQAGDEIIANNNSYFVSLLQENQNNGRQMNVEARGTEYFLQNVLILSETKNDVFNYADITLEEIFTGSVYRTSIDNYTDFTIHFNDVPTEILNSIKTVEFNEDNIYSATQKICEAWNIEFLVDGYDIYFREKVGSLTPVKTLVANQNTDVIQRNIDTSNVVTRIYPKGSTENLPPNYNYSNGLRPTIFDIASGVHSIDTGLTPPRNYFYDSDNIDPTNPIEKMVTFDDVKVHLRKGNADLFIDELDENSNPLKAHIITKSSITDIDLTRCQTEDKDGNLQYYITLYLEGGLYNITGARITNIDKANSRIDFIFPDDQDVSSFQTGLDNYVFILENYLSNKEINEASEELASKALDHLELNKYPKVVYTLSGAFSVDQTEMFDVGDYIRIQDDTLRSFSEFEEEDIRQGLKVRVQKYEFDVDKGVYTSLEVSNKPLEIPYNIVKTQKELKEKLKEQTVELNNSAIKAYKAEQRLNRLLNHHFYGSPEEYLKIGADDRNYSLYGLEFDPDSDDSLNRITTTLSVFALNKDPLVTVNIQGRTDVELTPFPGTFYMYIRIKKGTEGIMGFDKTSLDNTIMYYNVNNGKIDSEDDSYYYFLLGLVTTYSDKKKAIDTSYGFTYIDGNRLYTGTVYADDIRANSALFTKANNWDTVYNDWDEKNANWNTAYTRSSLITEITSDNYVDPSEKKVLKQRLNEISEQKNSLINYVNNNSSKFDASTEITELNSAFNNLSDYLTNTININDVTTSKSVTTTIRNTLNTYFANFNAKFETLRNKLETDIYGHADSAVTELNSHSSEWSTAYSRTQDMTTDLKIDIAEKKSLQKQLQNIKKQVNSMVTFAAEHNTSDLTTTERNALTNASNNGSLDVYEDYLINTLLINDLTKSETITQTQRDDLNTKTDNLNGDIQDLRNKLEEVIYSKADLAFENAASKAKVFYGSTTPSSPNVDDIWMRTTEGYRGVWRYSGSSWVKVDDEKALEAYTEAQSANTLASSKAKVFYQETAPTSGMVENDLWLDTTSGQEKLYVYRSSSWIEVQDADLNTAKSAVDNWKGTDYTNINGGVITTGKIQDSNGYSEIDMDTGYVRFGEIASGSYLVYDNQNKLLEIKGASLKLSSGEGEIVFSDSHLKLTSNGEVHEDEIYKVDNKTVILDNESEPIYNSYNLIKQYSFSNINYFMQNSIRKTDDDYSNANSKFEINNYLYRENSEGNINVYANTRLSVYNYSNSRKTAMLPDSEQLNLLHFLALESRISYIDENSVNKSDFGGLRFGTNFGNCHLTNLYNTILNFDADIYNWETSPDRSLTVDIDQDLRYKKSGTWKTIAFKEDVDMRRLVVNETSTSNFPNGRYNGDALFNVYNKRSYVWYSGNWYSNY